MISSKMCQVERDPLEVLSTSFHIQEPGNSTPSAREGFICDRLIKSEVDFGNTCAKHPVNVIQYDGAATDPLASSTNLKHEANVDSDNVKLETSIFLAKPKQEDVTECKPEDTSVIQQESETTTGILASEGQNLAEDHESENGENSSPNEIAGEVRSGSPDYISSVPEGNNAANVRDIRVVLRRLKIINENGATRFILPEENLDKTHQKVFIGLEIKYSKEKGTAIKGQKSIRADKEESNDPKITYARNKHRNTTKSAQKKQLLKSLKMSVNQKVSDNESELHSTLNNSISEHEDKRLVNSTVNEMEFLKGQKSFQCPYCDKPYKKKLLYEIHIRSHSGIKPFQCKECGKKFSSDGVLRAHYLTHTRESMVECATCGKKLASKYSLINHLRTHTGEKPYLCSLCGKRFSFPETLVRHTQAHMGRRFYECNICGKKLATTKSLAYHTETHTGEKPFQCEICGKRLRAKSTYKMHLELHKDRKSKQYECDICDKKFLHKGSLQNHKVFHNQVVECAECGKQFNRKEYLINHLRIHTGERPYKCETCGKGFTQIPALQRHLVVHSGVKPYSCDQCGRPFGDKTDMRRHKLRYAGVHFYCEICKEIFTSDFARQAHDCNRGDKSVSCNECGKKFCRKDYLSKHIESKHGK